MEHYDYTAGGEYDKRGYLKEQYKIFDICSKEEQEFEFHYHEFHKVIFFFSGRVKYMIEGREFRLVPNDILIVRQGDIHKPIIDPSVNYKRAVMWIDSNFLGDLNPCFETSVLLRESSNFDIVGVLKALLAEKDAFASHLMRENLFLQIMIMLNRAVMNKTMPAQYYADKQIESIIEYINRHLFEDLSIELLAEKFYISRYYLMHKFKSLTGKTIYAYIQTKRLLHSAQQISAGIPPKQACFESGYRDYSVFFKAFKKEFGVSPTEYAR